MGACDLKSVTDVWVCVQESMALTTWPAGADKLSVQQKSCGFKSSKFKLKLPFSPLNIYRTHNEICSSTMLIWTLHLSTLRHLRIINLQEKIQREAAAA